MIKFEYLSIDKTQSKYNLSSVSRKNKTYYSLKSLNNVSMLLLRGPHFEKKVCGYLVRNTLPFPFRLETFLVLCPKWYSLCFLMTRPKVRSTLIVYIDVDHWSFNKEGRRRMLPKPPSYYTASILFTESLNTWFTTVDTPPALLCGLGGRWRCIRIFILCLFKIPDEDLSWESLNNSFCLQHVLFTVAL